MFGSQARLWANSIAFVRRKSRSPLPSGDSGSGSASLLTVAKLEFRGIVVSLSFIIQSAIIRRLHLEHLRIMAAQAGELLVITVFGNAPVLQHDDAVGHAHG